MREKKFRFKTAGKKTEIFGIIATILAVAGVLLNNRLDRNCFYVWIVSNCIVLGIHFKSGLWSLAVRDFIFIVLAIEGLIRWSNYG